MTTSREDLLQKQFNNASNQTVANVSFFLKVQFASLQSYIPISLCIQQDMLLVLLVLVIVGIILPLVQRTVVVRR